MALCPINTKLEVEDLWIELRYSYPTRKQLHNIAKPIVVSLFEEKIDSASFCKLAYVLWNSLPLIFGETMWKRRSGSVPTQT